ncbi:magnesium transporter CorA family protein [Nakamurella endophytica]|uniref:Magnesium transporter CorA n=1 Tax=Nakamurella endophytica TaxID=1748367 RepID=A0A917SYP3_9ACTN|nr:CorA family divalent cation transporter [Nakamurella endophytica]GGM02852.1 magnesium transporter CorA [Nakamurella endophytica]
MTTDTSPRTDAGGGPAAGPPTMLWRRGGVVAPGIAPQDIGAELRSSGDCSAWLFVPRRDSETLRAAADYLGLDVLAVEDVLGDREGVKADWLGDTLVALTPMVAYSRDAVELSVEPVSLIAGRRILVVVADDGAQPVLRTALARAEAQVVDVGIPAALHAVLDRIVDGYSAALTAMQDDLDDMADMLFDDRPLARAEQLRSFGLRRSMGRLARITGPMRDVAASLANAAARPGTGDAAGDPAATLLGTRMAREFSDVADHANHADQATKSMREEIGSMYETNLALSDVHLNMVMKKLSAWAAIIAVPTLITGFMGMNVPYPGFSQRQGFLAAMVVIIVAVIGLYVVFKRKDWL